MRFHMSSFMQNFPHERLILVRAPSIFITKHTHARVAFSYLAHLKGKSGAYAPCKYCQKLGSAYFYINHLEHFTNQKLSSKYGTFYQNQPAGWYTSRWQSA